VAFHDISTVQSSLDRLLVGVLTATAAVLGNLVASAVPPSLVKPYLFAILPSFIGISVLLAFLTRGTGSQQTSASPIGGPSGPLPTRLTPQPLTPPHAHRQGARLAGIATLAAAVAWVIGSLLHLAPPSHLPASISHAPPIVGPFAPQPSDPTALQVWNYARKHAIKRDTL